MQKIALGTAAVGRPLYMNIRQEAAAPFSLEAFRKNAWDVLENAYQKGIRYFDTAPNYGMAEELLIDWLKSKEDKNIELATKWGYTYVANFDMAATAHEVKEHSLKNLNRQWKQSKKLLPNLSTYQIHSATFETGVLENDNVLDRLLALKEEHGLLIGISSTGANQVEIIKKALSVNRNGIQLFDVFQATYNVLDQSLREIAAELNEQNKRIVIKEGMANGRVFRNEGYPHYIKLYDTLDKLAKKYKVGVDAIVLRFCIDSIQPYVVLSGGSINPHVNQNLKAADFELEEADLETLKSHKEETEDYWKERKQISWS